jgi:hypothetical protein
MFNDDYREKVDSKFGKDEYAVSPNDNPLCCCGNASMKHDESTKFKLICDEDYYDYVIFKNKQEGDIIEYTNKRFEFPRINYYGRKA